ncbi:MAG: FecR domain-containing protein [Gemmatimonadota bacterium]|nr:FecR domain-containing protein [Gemmatimonadota bacterium]
MDELLLRHLRRQTTDEENATVAEWLRGSAERERELAELGRLVEAGKMADRRIVPGDVPAAEGVIWRAEARKVGSGVGRLGRRLRLPRPRRRFDLVAAGVVALAASMVFQFFVSGTNGGPGSAPVLQDFATGPGETELVRLADGTVIRLGPDSRLITWADPSARTATFQGQAFFAVATDEARPFTIVADAGTARVLGTRFHLAAHTDELAVTVVEGRVALAGPDHEVQVGAGQATSLLRGVPSPIEATAPIETVADWMAGFLIFHDTPLDAAMNEVEQHYGVEVVVGDAALLDRTLTMWFDSKSLSEVMTVVCSVIDARCSIDAGVVRIESADRGAAS